MDGKNLTHTKRAPIRVVAIGDCNTATLDPHQGTLPDGLCEALNARSCETQLHNLGGGMLTSREGLAYLKKESSTVADLAIINFGLVDAWVTSIPAIYVPYFPDTFVRKRMRKLLKFTKRQLRSKAIRRWVPKGHVVPIDEFHRNIRTIIRELSARNSSVKVFLWGTIPVADDTERNKQLQRYNKALNEICCTETAEYVDTETLVQSLSMSERFLDGVHISPASARIVGTYITRKYLSEVELEAPKNAA